MSVVTLRRMAVQPPEAIFTPFEMPERSGYDSIVDLSALTAQPSETFSSGRAWMELPTLGADGRITGVLCKSAAVDFPTDAPAHVGRVAAHAYAHDLGNLLAVIDGGLRLLDKKTDACDRAMIVERLHRAVERGAVLSRRMLNGAQSEEPRGTELPSGHEQIVDVSDLLDRTLQADVVVDTDIDPSLRRSSGPIRSSCISPCSTFARTPPTRWCTAARFRSPLAICPPVPAPVGSRSRSLTTASACRRMWCRASSSHTSRLRSPAKARDSASPT
jgi:hypothetical protein